VIAEYESLEEAAAVVRPAQSAADFQLVQQESEEAVSGDVLVIGGSDIKGMNYKLARCCNPIYGDEVFGFVSAEGVVKVHRCDCPNAPDILRKYPYRIITTRWSGKLGEQLGATLRIVGVDDIGIVTNITSIINKEKGAQLRNISIDSNDGIFHGYLVVGVSDRDTLTSIIRNLKTVKGVKDVQRSK
jgi:GTP pyrophosphokinase